MECIKKYDVTFYSSYSRRYSMLDIIFFVDTRSKKHSITKLLFQKPRTRRK